MPMSVALVEVPLYPNTLPLASGYLQAYALQDPHIARSFTMTIHSRAVSHPTEDLIRELLALDCDVYAMSCYLWNMRRMSAVLEALVEARPGAQFILGGPQVMDHMTDYVSPRWENVVAADTEGEIPFAAYLRELASPRPDLSHVPGLSYWSGGEACRTPKPDRIKDLDEIPSPFTAGIFDGQDYTFAVAETNRGCPFRCSYCYWGAATNDKVYRWDVERVKRDLEWVSEHGVESIFLADANWGALPRDVELTRHLVACKERYGYPLMVNLQAAKNRPDRVTEITEILVGGGMLTSQPVSLQTVSPVALEMVQRTNIRETTYITLQKKLHEKRISSYTELIWPLPGETLDSFHSGIGRLCRSGADAIVTYPQLLLRNTPMERQRERFGIETVRVTDDASEADVVIGTKWVNREEYEAGVWFYYAVATLYNARGAYHTMAYLDSVGATSYVAVFDAAALWFRRHSDEPLARFFADSVATLDNYDINNIGKVLHMALHSHRAETDRMLVNFFSGTPWWRDPMTRALLEVDLLARPYVYREPVAAPDVPLDCVKVLQRERYGFVIELPEAVLRRLSDTYGTSGAGLEKVNADSGKEVAPDARILVRLDHRGRRKMPYPRQRSLEHNASYCQAMMNRLQDILPLWSSAQPAESLAE